MKLQKYFGEIIRIALDALHLKEKIKQACFFGHTKSSRSLKLNIALSFMQRERAPSFFLHFPEPFSIFFPSVFVAVLTTIIIIAFPQNSIGETRANLSQKSSNSIKITMDDGLISLKVKNTGIRKIFKELSKVSGVPIVLLAKDNTSPGKVSISLKNVSVELAIKKIMDKFPGGGLAGITNVKSGGKGSIKKFYVLTGKVEKSLLKQADKLLKRIKKGEKPKPKEINDWLITLFSNLGLIDPEGTGLYAVPVLLMLDKNYARYKDIILSLFQNRVASVVLRSAMLEIIGNHWKAEGSEKAVFSVFYDQKDRPVMVGKSAALLAQHHVDIGDEVLGRYGTAPPIAKFYYAGALASLDRKEAEPLLRKDAVKSKTAFVRAAAIRALGKISPDEPDTIHTLSQIVNEASEEPHPAGTFVDDSLSMEAVAAISRSKKPKIYLTLLSVAENIRQTIDVRITALDELIKAPKSVSARVLQAMEPLMNKVKISKLLTKADKERMFGRISRLKKALSK